MGDRNTIVPNIFQISLFVPREMLLVFYSPMQTRKHFDVSFLRSFLLSKFSFCLESYFLLCTPFLYINKVGTIQGTNTFGKDNKTVKIDKKKIATRDEVVTNVHMVHMKGIGIREKIMVNSEVFVLSKA